MGRGRMTRKEYRNKSARTGHGKHSKPDYISPHCQSGYNLQKPITPQNFAPRLKDRTKTSKLIRLSKGA